MANRITADPPRTVEFDDREAGVAVYRLIGEDDDDQR